MFFFFFRHVSSNQNYRIELPYLRPIVTYVVPELHTTASDENGLNIFERKRVEKT